MSDQNRELITEPQPAQDLDLKSFWFLDSILFLSSGVPVKKITSPDSLFQAERIDSHLVGSRTEWGGQGDEGASGPGLP